MPAPEPGERWGILGGVYDPLHNGHLTLARDIMSFRHLDGVIFVPTLDPPHRTNSPVASYDDRVRMAELAISDMPGFEVSRIEENTNRPSYTLETVRALKKAYPGAEYELIIGADQLTQLKTWYHWEDLLKEVILLVGSRPGSEVIALSDFPSDRVVAVETSLVDLSSTHIRSRIRQGVPQTELETMMPPAVVRYILERNLYR